jgi:D-xylulose reductase
VGSLSRFFALPADMAPKIPDDMSWAEAGAIQPLAIGVQIGIRADIRAHQTLAIMGCGPIGLISAAVAHTYGVSRIIGFDINPKRVAFAKSYLSPTTKRPIFDHVFLVEKLPTTKAASEAEKASAGKAANGNGNGANGHCHSHDAHHDDDDHVPPGDIKFECAKLRAKAYLSTVGIDDGVDRVIEASGAEDAGMLGVAIAKQGGICEYRVGMSATVAMIVQTGRCTRLNATAFLVFVILYISPSIPPSLLQLDAPASAPLTRPPDLAVGLGHHQTNAFPTLAVTNKELEVRGITRYTSPCFPNAIDMLRRGVVDLKPLITLVLPLRESQKAFEAVASGEEIKVVIMNQEV